MSALLAEHQGQCSIDWGFAPLGRRAPSLCLVAAVSVSVVVSVVVAVVVSVVVAVVAVDAKRYQ